MNAKKVAKHNRFVPPIMQAFRSAFRERDSGKEVDIRTDADERIIAGRRTTPRNTVNENTLRQELADDLSSLLNTVNLAAAVDLEEFDDVRHSIINYGVDDLTSISSGSRGVNNVGPRLLEVLRDYESRLADESLRIVSDQTNDDVNTRVSLHVSGEMYATPSDVPVEFVADVEAYSGKVKVKQG